LELFRLCSLHLRPRFLALVRRAHGLQVDRRIRLPQDGGFIELVAIFAALAALRAAPHGLDCPRSPKIGELRRSLGPKTDARTSRSRRQECPSSMAPQTDCGRWAQQARVRRPAPPNMHRAHAENGAQACR